MWLVHGWNLVVVLKFPNIDHSVSHLLPLWTALVNHDAVRQLAVLSMVMRHAAWLLARRCLVSRRQRILAPQNHAPQPCLFELRHYRSFHLEQALIPPALFTGLFIALWCWKCTMLVVFQNVIIYNPFLPPDARRLEIVDYARQCRGVSWRKEMIRSLDGTPIALCVSDEASDEAKSATSVYILYFQGNASSLPPRLPELSSILRRVRDADASANYTVIGVSYRGYWKSHDRPSEKGINKDTEAALRWVTQLHEKRQPQSKDDAVVLLWGQSVGCGFASNLAASTARRRYPQIRGMVLETPFTNTRAMLRALYPQKWLPYQYLWPFLRNHLDTYKNLELVAQKYKDQSMPVYIVEAGRDELVPQDHGSVLLERCEKLGLPAQLHTVRRALHNEVSIRREGKDAIAECIRCAVAAAQKTANKMSGISSE